MKEIKAPNTVKIDGTKKIFLAGSIEMGAAENWQERLAELLKDDDVTLLNPRRDDWDSSWEQTKSNKQFSTQVNWELDSMELADVIVVYFDKDTKSPITLLELGIHIRSRKIVVCCPDGFWRKGNVDIVCEKYNVPQVNSIEGLVDYIRSSNGKFVITKFEDL